MRLNALLLACTIVLAACTGPRCNCDKEPRTLSANQEPAFPIGWYDRLAEDHLRGIAQSGVNTVLPYVERLPTSAIRSYLDEAVSHNLHVVVEVRWDWVTHRNFDAIRQFVREFKSHRAVRGWYLADEPENTHVDPAVVREAFDVIASEDDSHPVATAFAQLKKARAYGGTSDAYMWDRYLLTRDTPPLKKLSQFRENVHAAAAEAAQAKQLFWPILEAYQESASKGGDARRLATVTEMRYMVFCTLLERPSGLFFWWWHATDSNWVASVLSPIIVEIKPLVSAIRRPPVPDMAWVTTLGVRAVTFPADAPGAYVLFLVNDSGASKTARVSLHPSLGTKQLISHRDGTEGGRAVSREFSETLEPYGVRAYELR